DRLHRACRHRRRGAREVCRTLERGLRADIAVAPRLPWPGGGSLADRGIPRAGVTLDPRTPVIVGAGQVLHHDASEEESSEPVVLIAEALRRAGEDSGVGERLLRDADSVRCVPVIGWPYRDAAALLAEDLGARPRETAQSAVIGGDGPQRLLNDTARAIAAGEIDVALVGGGEAVASLRAAQLAGRTPRWRRQPQRVRPPRTLGQDRAPINDAETAAGLGP